MTVRGSFCFGVRVCECLCCVVGCGARRMLPTAVSMRNSRNCWERPRAPCSGDCTDSHRVLRRGCCDIALRGTLDAALGSRSTNLACAPCWETVGIARGWELLLELNWSTTASPGMLVSDRMYAQHQIYQIYTIRGQILNVIAKRASLQKQKRKELWATKCTDLSPTCFKPIK